MIKSKAAWVVVGGAPGELGHCARCGRGLDLGPNPQSLGVAVAAMKAFVRDHAHCQPGQHKQPASITPEEWKEGRDTGISSLTIYYAVKDMPVKSMDWYDVPHDPSDFGRCYRFLKLFPYFRLNLDSTINYCPEWKPFVEHWDELTALYEQESPTGMAPKLYARIQQLRQEGSESKA